MCQTKITNIEIRNYRQYQQLTFDFAKTGENDLHVIVAQNGVGKTNLLNSITWCLYGKEPHLGDEAIERGLPKLNLLALEEAANDLEEDFMKKGVLLIVDGTDPELVRAILETELSSIESRHSRVVGFWDTLAAMGPAWGMIGTLIGLVNMLKQMSDPDSIGPAMALALITTLYGSMLANWICAPVANKLKIKTEEEITMKEIVIEGLLSIQAGENPRVIEEKLKSFLAPSERATEKEAGGELDG
ncbi:MAG: AAA family ATPase [Clostridiales bacterium]|nr:AAA family ATPase [Clostridiales bacterium]